MVPTHQASHLLRIRIAAGIADDGEARAAVDLHAGAIYFEVGASTEKVRAAVFVGSAVGAELTKLAGSVGLAPHQGNTPPRHTSWALWQARRGN